jgi:hypothetical protein
MKIRITGKSLRKAQVGGEEPKSIKVNNITYTPGHPDWERIKKEYADNNAAASDVRDQVNNAMGTPRLQESIISQPRTTMQVPAAPTTFTGAMPNITMGQQPAPNWGNLIPSVNTNAAVYNNLMGNAPQVTGINQPKAFTSVGNTASPSNAWTTTAAPTVNLPAQPTQYATAKPVANLSAAKNMIGQSSKDLQNTLKIGSAKDIKAGIAGFNSTYGTDLKDPRLFKLGAKGRETLGTIGKGADALQTGIAVASALTDFIDNGNQQRNFNSYMRDQQMSDNLYPVTQGSRGDYVQTGTSYGAFRPDEMTVNKGMFAEMGGELNTETMKIRITSGPARLEYGGQAKNVYGLDLGKGHIYGEMNENPIDSMSSSMSEIENPNEPYTLETEGGEEVLRPDGTKFRLVGDSHANGGIKNTASQIPSGSYIYSKKLKETNPEILSKFNKTYKRGGVSYSDISSQYDLNKFKSILDDPNADTLSKSTAQMMSDNYKKKLGQLALVQEAKKGFKKGIPQVYTNSIEQAAYGGYVPMFATGGDALLTALDQVDPYAGGKEKTPTGKSNKYDRGKDYLENWEKFIPGVSKLSNKEAQSKIYDLIYEQNPSAINEMWTKYGLTNEGKKYKDLTGLTKNGTFTKQLGPDQLKALKKAYVDGFFGARQLDPSAIPPPSAPPPGTPPAPPSKTPPAPPLVPPTLTQPKNPTPYDFLAPDKMSMLTAGMNAPKKYLPYYANYAANIPTPTFYSPERELAANAEQANIQTQGLANFAGPQSFMSNSSAIQGKAAEQAANTLGRYNNLNVGVANQFSPMIAETLNKQAMYAAERANELFKGNVVANQQYDNAKRSYFTNLTKSYANAWNNRMNLGDINDNNAYYYKDPNTGRNVLKGPIGDISTLGMYGSSTNMGQTGVSNLGSAYNNLYNNYLSQLKDNGDMTPEEKKKQAGNLANLGLRSMQQTRTVNSRNPFMFNQRSTGFTGMDSNNFDDDLNNDIL